MHEQGVVELRDNHSLVMDPRRCQLVPCLERDVLSILDAVRQRHDRSKPERLVAREVITRPERPPLLLEDVTVGRERDRGIHLSGRA